jgi:hypothetical protein
LATILDFQDRDFNTGEFRDRFEEFTFMARVSLPTHPIKLRRGHPPATFLPVKASGMQEWDLFEPTEFA